MKFYAHTVEGRPEAEWQSLKEHLINVSVKAGQFASKIGLGKSGELLGLFHDFGKYSDEFRNYLSSSGGIINSDEDDYIDLKGKKGKIDHSSAGAQIIYHELNNKGTEGLLASQLLALCVASHHSGLLDCIEPDGRNNFNRRMSKPEIKAHKNEAYSNIDEDVKQKFNELLADDILIPELKTKLDSLVNKDNDSKGTLAFKKGLLVRYLFSCLIDADRLDTADFESPVGAALRNNGKYTSWDILTERLNVKLKQFEQKKDKNHIDIIRQEISSCCYDFSKKSRGLYQLTVPTGGGKTFSSLRFALNHAEENEMERIIYVIPYTSIIDQNADEVRKILEDKDNNGNYLNRVVLEHHSNLTPDEESWKQKILSEDWDAPVVFTTNVQVLEALFGYGTRSARRMHQLANSVLIFDEIQTLPVRCVHMFNVALRFLVENCNSTVVLCTATQPLLDKIESKYHALPISFEQKMMPDENKLYDELKRVEVINKCKIDAWSEPEIKEFAEQILNENGSVLVVVNTKKSAESLYRQINNVEQIKKYHLSTSMCPVHRMEILDEIKLCLDNHEKLICISTQLIEAGVDIDFNSVIRYVAGLDSIAQAAGRCNRHGILVDANGEAVNGKVFIVNPKDENLDKLPDIKIGQEKTERILREFRENPVQFDYDIIGLKAMERYYKYYFYERKNVMNYPVTAKSIISRDDNLFNLLSLNTVSVDGYIQNNNTTPILHLKQSFMSAAKLFHVIDSPAQGIIVPYGRGEDIILDLCKSSDIDKEFKLLKEAQRYSVNIFPYIFEKLLKEKAVYEIQEEAGIYYLDKQYYSKHYGVCEEPVNDMEFLGV